MPESFAWMLFGVLTDYGFFLLLILREARQAKEARKTLMMLLRDAPPGTVIAQRIAGQQERLQLTVGNWADNQEAR